jgi:hypothetical protein
VQAAPSAPRQTSKGALSHASHTQKRAGPGSITAWLCLALLFVSVRVYAAAQGVAFDASPLDGFWHLVDRDLLSTRLAESIYYLHAQPPLFNLWLGLFLKAFGAACGAAFAASFLVLGALHAVVLVQLGRCLGLPSVAAVALAALFCASPSALLYENFLFYSYPVLVLVSASACLLQRALTRRGLVDFAWFFAALTAIVLTRSLFHPALLVLTGAACVCLTWRTPAARSRLLIPCAAGSALVLLFLCKNLLLFGSFSLSSWGGMSLARVVLDRTPTAQRAAWIAQGELSAFASASGFKPLAHYPLDPSWLAPTGVPLLDRPYKRDGAPNFHHRAYLAVSRALFRDATRVARREPAIYLASVRENLAQSGKSAWTYRPLAAQRQHIAGYVRGFSSLFGWIPGLGGTSALGVLTLALYALSRARADRAGRAGLFLYAAGLCLYVVFVGALFERSENQRFRLLVDPLLLLLAACAAHDALERLRRAVRASSSS